MDIFKPLTSEVLKRLDCEGPDSRGWYKAECPAHNDNEPSLGFKDENDRAVINCLAGCDLTNVLAALGFARIYDYRDAESVLWGQVVRFLGDDKVGRDFKVRRPGKDGQWVWDWRGVKKTVYRLPELLAYYEKHPEAAVYVVEGEKDVDSLAQVGITATTNPHGAGQGKWTDEYSAVFRDRNVVVVPDNDKDGYRHAEEVARSLHKVAREVRVVQVPSVKVKDDVSDFLSRGGTKADLVKLARQAKAYAPPVEPEPVKVTKPELRTLEGGGYGVLYPYLDGSIALAFRDITSHKAGVIDADLKVTCHKVTGAYGEPFRTRLNILSNSGQQGIGRSLASVFDTDDRKLWPRVLNIACSRVAEAVGKETGLSDFEFDFDESTPTETFAASYLVRPYVPDDGASIIFGDGKSGKSYFTQLLGLHVALGRPFFGEPVQQGAVIYCNFEKSGARTIENRLIRLLCGLGWTDPESRALAKQNFRHWKMPGQTLDKQKKALKKAVSELEVKLVIIDSALAACGGDPSAPQTASAFFNDLEFLEVPVIVISHETKAEEVKRPFGSVLWTNLPRSVWNVQAEKRPGSSIMEVALIHRYVNDDQLYEPHSLTFAFVESGGPVTVERNEKLSLSFSHEYPVADQMEEELTEKPGQTREELVAATSCKPNAVKSALYRGERTGRFSHVGARWYVGELPVEEETTVESEEARHDS